MLKICWDCVCGNGNREQRGNGDSYNIVSLNGDTQSAPQWPSGRHKNENMFVIPRKLNSGDKIDVSGVMTSDRQRVTVNLLTGYSSPDEQNIACQVETLFPASNEDRVVVRIIQNGNTEEVAGDHQDLSATDFFTGSEFTFNFSMSVDYYDGSHNIAISLGDNSLTNVTLKHRIDDIRFLSLYGDIEKITKLNFSFG